MPPMSAPSRIERRIGTIISESLLILFLGIV
jgi:hypothetical protein